MRDAADTGHLDHVTITAVDFARSAAFYDAALGALGMERLSELVDEEEDDAPVEAAAWGLADEPDDDRLPHAVVWLVSGAVATSGLHLCLYANARLEVETFHAAAVEAGGTSHHAPRRWTPYRRGQFQAVVRDPNGNLVEVCCAE